MTPAGIRWRDDGTPLSPRFGDIYRSAGTTGQGGLDQARHVFLRGCGLLGAPGGPALWAGTRSWSILELGFGLGLNFLATWQAWRNDTDRPARLLYSAIEAFPPEPQDLQRSAAPFPALRTLAEELAARWRGLLPGVHRLPFDGGRVCLTLAVGDARTALYELAGRHDSIYLDGFSPARNPDMWALLTLKAATRLARRGTRAATWCVAADVRQRLQQCGFQVQRVPGLPPKRHALQSVYDPAWPIRRRRRSDHVVCRQPARCAVIGAGIAGAAAAWSLAQRGWQVSVFERAERPCAGASGVPVGLVAPHVSPDDCALSQLTRAGVRATFARARTLLAEGEDFAITGVLERHATGQRRLPPSWAACALSPAMRAGSHDAADAITQARARAAGLPLDAQHPALWHDGAGWLRPSALVAAMLAAPGIDLRLACPIASIIPRTDGWQLLGPDRAQVAQAELVVVAAGLDTLQLLGRSAAALPLHALRGQVTCGPMPQRPEPQAWPAFPVNGLGHFVANLPGDGGRWWQAGATFERGSADTHPRPADNGSNRRQLAQLLPTAARALAAVPATGWAGVRATLPNHLPAVGAWLPGTVPGMRGASEQEAWGHGGRLPLHLCTGMGARGLTLAILCGDILAATLHDEPWPISQKLMRQLGANRYAPRRR